MSDNENGAERAINRARAEDRANVEAGFGASNPHAAAQRELHLADAGSYRKAAAIDPPNRAEYIAGARDELAAAQQYRMALVQQGAALRQIEEASQRASMKAPDDEAKATNAPRMRI